MKPSRSETSRVSRPRPASMLEHARREAGNLAHPKHGNWHLPAARAHGTLWAGPSAPFTGRVLP